MTHPPLEIPALQRLRRWSLLVALVAGILCALGAWIDPDRFFPAYLVGYLFWLGISLGSLAIAMLHHLTGGGWGLPIRRILEASYGNTLLLALLFLPLVLGIQTLYPWARPEVIANDELVRQKIRYLNVPAWEVRAAVYFVLWAALGWLLSRWSAQEGPPGQRRRERRLVRLSGGGLIVWALAVTFAAVDWVMSLEPHWYSSMFGVLFMGAQSVSGLSFAILAASLLQSEPPWSSTLTASRLQDLSSLLLAFVMFWSYASFMQFLIIWSGNLPEDTPWYIHRSRGGWQIVAALLAGLHFAVPFLLLLQRRIKREPRQLIRVALLLLAMRMIDLAWLVLPTFSPGRFALSGWLLVTPLAIGGFWLSAFAWRLSIRAAIPVYDPAHARTTE
ncbi:MAG: hypothetical protein WD872_14455 [Pirellulaceae bacterium]